MKKSLLALATTFALTAGSVYAFDGNLLIDDFNDPWAAPGQSVVSDGNPAHVENTLTGLSGVLGGARKLEIDCVSGCTDASLNKVAALTVETGELAWSNGAGVRSTATITWDADGAGLGLDLTPPGYILATVLEADLGFNYELALWTDNSNYTTLKSGTLFAVPATNPEDAAYNLNWFTLADGNYTLEGLPFTIVNTGAGVTLSNVNKITLNLNNNSVCYQTPGEWCSVAVDLRIDNARVVPEPSTVALLGLGLLGLAGLRKRKQA